MKIWTLAMAMFAVMPCFAQWEHGMMVGDTGQIPVLSTLRAVPVTGTTPPRRTKSSGTYYRRPEGGYYVGFGYDGRGYYPTMLYVRPWQAIVFENTDEQKRGEWHTWTFSKLTNQGDYFDDPSVVVDGDGNYRMSYAPGEQYYTPTLTWGADSFFIGEECYFHVLQANNSVHPGRLMAGGKVIIKSTDDHQRFYYMGGTYSNLQRWGVVGDNVFGTGLVSGRYPSYGAAQVFDKPMAPLAVYRVFVQGCSYSGQPIPDGDTLTCYVSKCTTRQLSNGTVLKVPTHEYTDTLHAIATDTLGFVSSLTRNGKTIYDGYVLFSKRVEDGEGNHVETPVVINPDDYDENGFALVVDGFDREGVDLGVYGYYFNNDVDDVQEGLMLFRDPNTGNTGFNVYGNSLAMDIGMEALYDAVIISNLGGGNVMYVSADGETCAVRGDTSQGVVVKTSREWNGEGGASNYYLEGLPEWVTEVRVDDTPRTKPGRQGESVLSFVCQPLPEGVDRRSASMTVKGVGTEGRTPVHLIQDRVTLHVGHVQDDSPHDSGRSYTLEGQAWGGRGHGIVVRNGRKHVVK